MGSEGTALYSKQVVTPDGVREAVVLLRDATIYGVCGADAVPPDFVVEDLSDRVIMPGLVDSHVHINEPGRTDWEGFFTATRAALAGGITALADMPLNCQPVTTSADALALKLAAARDKIAADCLFFGGVVPGNEDQLSVLADSGVVGFKCFLIHSGIDDFPAVTESDLRKAMPILAACGLPLLVHAELECEDCGSPWDDGRSYAQFLHSRPRKWENDAIALMLRLCAEYGCRVHIVHLSSADMVPQIRQARANGLPFTVETCPHYLTFASEEIADGDTLFKCAPPIREGDNRERLWQALADGIIDIVVSDHSPCTPDLKLAATGDVKNAWGGISSLQLRLPVMWTEATARGFALSDLTRWLCSGPAEFLGLSGRKGSLAPGMDADIVVWNPDAEFVVDRQLIFHKHKDTPYQHKHLRGVVERTYLRGELVFDRGEFADGCGGNLLLRGIDGTKFQS